MGLITISEYVNCPVCDEGKLMPISKTVHHTSRGENFWGEVVDSSSAIVPIAQWQCSHCGHFTTKANNGRYYRYNGGWEESIDWSRTCDCDHCRPIAKKRFAAAKAEKAEAEKKRKQKNYKRDRARTRLIKARKKGFFKNV